MDLGTSILSMSSLGSTCAMRDSCGSVGWAGQQLPCPYDGPPVEPDNQAFRDQLVSVCGSDYAKGPTCCTADQVDVLRSNFQQVEGLIGSCPACRNNFRDFFCTFTCSPIQGSFLNVSSTQETNSGATAVKSVEYHVDPQYGEGFFGSCKDIKYGATNGYVMDLLGGGAKTYTEFFKYLGQLRPGLGSPFQINFPTTPSSPEITPFNATARNCADSELSSRCTCVDCPSVCPVLPALPAPGSQPGCHVGLISCLSFALMLVYLLALSGFIGGYGLIFTLRKKRRHERLVLLQGASTDGTSTPSSGLLGATSLSHHYQLETEDAGTVDPRASSGRGASLLDPEGLQPRHYRLNTILRRGFYRIGYACASRPFIVFMVASLFIALTNTGWAYFEVEKDPVRLWVAPTSESKVQKEFFDESFGPFYRIEQVFVSVASIPSAELASLSHPSLWSPSNSPILSFETLQWWFEIEQDIRSLRSHPNDIGFEDVCFKPAGPGTPCVVQSVSAWFGGSLTDDDRDSWQDVVTGCAVQPAACLPDFGQPLNPEYVLGLVPASDDDSSAKWLQARALVINFIVADSLNETVRTQAQEWETELRRHLEDLAARAPLEAGVRLDFSTGVSLEEELNKSTNTDVTVVALSYVLMFLYVSLTLGRGGDAGDDGRGGLWTTVRRWASSFRPSSGISSSASSITSNRGTKPFLRRIFVKSHVLLGTFAIGLVLLSISSSIGVFSFLGVKVTLIIAEVIPFLVLAVGVDNVFLLLAELDRQNSFHGPYATAIPPGSASMATPMSPSSTRQRSPFNPHERDQSSGANSTTSGLGGTTYLPPEERVARTLAKMGPSILMSTGTQTVAFALGALVPMPAVRNFALYAALSVLLGAIFQVTIFIAALTLDLKRMEASRVDCFPFFKIPARIALPEVTSGLPGGTLSRFFRRIYAPFLLQSPVKAAVVAIFGGMAVLSVISIQHIELGLDQKLALPSDSYLNGYFNAVESYLDVGPPVYFVSTGINVTSRHNQQELCARFTTCNNASIANSLEAERKRTPSSFISEGSAPASWIDDFLHWLDPVLETCCRVRKADPNVFCRPRDSDRLCRPCLQDQQPAWNITMEGLPEGIDFNRYLVQWLESPTNEECPLGGRTAYGAALALDTKTSDVVASHFRTFHSPLRTQADFIHAYDAAHRIAQDLTEQTGATVFPYSIFYVFFEQYAHIIGITQEVLGLGLAAVLLMTSTLLGSWRVGMIVTGVVGLTIVNIMGIMGIWSISLNAISLVNLVIALGIAVEFCSHIARAFVSSGSTILTNDKINSQKERDERMLTTLVDVGPSVLSGITFTKLVGIAVLGMTRSKLLEIYYFRMWLSLIILGALHGLVLLPVLLSWAGGPGYAVEDADEEWMSSTIRRHDFEYTPFLDSDSVMSE